MLRTLRMDRDIPPDRRVEFVLPDDFPTGEAELVLVVMPKNRVPLDSISGPNEDYIGRRRQIWLGHDE